MVLATRMMGITMLKF